MPTATSFAALGKGNGFPFCVPEVDVSSFPYWVTMGNFKKTDSGSPTQEQIDLSLSNAMKLFWNFNGYTAVLGGNSDDAGTYTIDIDQEEYVLLSPSNTADPQSRVCNENTSNNWSLSSDPTLASARCVIQRMFNNSEFVGYGMKFSIGARDSSYPSRDFRFYSYLESSFFNSFDDFEVGYSSSIGIPFVFIAGTRNHPTGELSVSVSNLDATFTYIGSESNGRSSTLNLSPFDFYTYS